MGRSSVIQTALEVIHAGLLDVNEGEVASYIPELAKVDPDLFGVAVATADGHVYTAGDADEPFTIQSVSKPFVYGIALGDHGPENVLERIGVEPSGDAFNSIVMDERRNRPLNPMVNAGAIAASALVRGDGLEHRSQRVLEAFSRYAGRPLDVDWDVYRSERRTGHRNRAIVYLELNTGMIEEPVEDHLDLYFRQCSIKVTARDLAVMAATLANGGVNPLTGESALSSDNVGRVLTVMATCGMYDWSGEWMYRVGLPAKSGVGGGILAVLPGQIGIGTYSPRLDELGNSRRGVRACEELGRTFSLHLFDASLTTVPVVRRRYVAAHVSSNRQRRAADRQLLDSNGHRIVVLELQGDLFFAPAERLSRVVEACFGLAGSIVLDTRRVGRANASAARLLLDLREEAALAGVRLLIAGCSPALRMELDGTPPRWPADGFVCDTDQALEQCEDELLIELRGFRMPAGPVPVSEFDILRDLEPDDIAAVVQLLETSEYAAGDAIVAEGDAADRMYFLVAGAATVRIGLTDQVDGSRRISTLEPGAAFGEAAILQGGRRTATVVADEPTTIRSLSVASIERLAEERPAVHAHIIACVGRNLYGMLGRTLAEVRALL